MTLSRPVLPLAALMLTALAGAQTAIVPPAQATAPGNGTFLGPLVNSYRRLQLLIDSSQLADIPIGSQLDGLSLRLADSATAALPAADITYSSYEIYLSGSVDPSAFSLTHANNIVGSQTQVRSGPLTFAAGSFGVGSSPKPWGPEIEFTPWTYNGGDLLVELRHSASNGPSFANDAMLATGPGYGTNFYAVSSATAGAATGTRANFVVTRLSYNPVPEPASLAAITLGCAALLRRHRR